MKVIRRPGKPLALRIGTTTFERESLTRVLIAGLAGWGGLGLWLLT